MTRGHLADGEVGLAGLLREQLAGRSMLGPGGEPGVAHRLRRRRGIGRITLRILSVVVAASSATAGALLAVSPPTVALRMTGAEYRLGDASLRAVASGEYRGQGALVIRHQADGSVVAAGSAAVRGVRVSGECLEDADRRTERCVFDLGGTGLGAIDTWTSGGWRRRYDDSQVVEIAASSPAPVPFPVGW